MAGKAGKWESMKIEITPDRKSLYVYEEETVILKTYPVLRIEDCDAFSWILFADVKGEQMEVLAGKAVFDEEGRLKTFDRHIHAADWKHLHQLFSEMTKR